MTILKLGFTGTQTGMTDFQEERLNAHLHRWIKKYKKLEIHHGDCIGADEEFHKICITYWENAYPGATSVVLHPPLVSAKRAYTTWVRQREETPLDYLARNHKIVEAVDGMLGAPKGMEEELRSGTWATIRYAKKIEKPLIVLWPEQ